MLSGTTEQTMVGTPRSSGPCRCPGGQRLGATMGFRTRRRLLARNTHARTHVSPCMCMQVCVCVYVHVYIRGSVLFMTPAPLKRWTRATRLKLCRPRCAAPCRRLRTSRRASWTAPFGPRRRRAQAAARKVVWNSTKAWLVSSFVCLKARMSRETSSCCSPLRSHNSPPISLRTRQRATYFRGTTKVLRLSRNVTTWPKCLYLVAELDSTYREYVMLPNALVGALCRFATSDSDCPS